MLRRSMDSSLPTPPPSRNTVRNRESNEEVSSVQVTCLLKCCHFLMVLCCLDARWLGIACCAPLSLLQTCCHQTGAIQQFLLLSLDGTSRAQIKARLCSCQTACIYNDCHCVCRMMCLPRLKVSCRSSCKQCAESVTLCAAAMSAYRQSWTSSGSKSVPCRVKAALCTHSSLCLRQPNL